MGRAGRAADALQPERVARRGVLVVRLDETWCRFARTRGGIERDQEAAMDAIELITIEGGRSDTDPLTPEEVT